MELLKKILFFDIFPFLCRLVACVLLSLGLIGISFPPQDSISTNAAFLLILSLFFLLLPIAKKISLGKILTFEREIGKVQNDVKEFKTETREFLNVYSNMITAISNTVNQTVNVHLPGKEEAEEAKEELNSTISENNGTSPIEDEIESLLMQSGNDLNFALARLRMELERNLREIIGKRTQTAGPNSIKSKFLSARQLFKEFTIQYPDYKGMHSSFDYILKVCNAAIHGQRIYDGHGKEALYMGAMMLNELEKIKKI